MPEYPITVAIMHKCPAIVLTNKSTIVVLIL